MSSVVVDRTTFYIVPALTDQAGQCRIVARKGFNGLARDDYRARPHLWAEVGLMSSRGALVCLSAAAQQYADIKSCEPLQAGLSFQLLDH